MRTTQLSDNKMLMSILSLAQDRGIDQNERLEEVLNWHVQAVAELFDRGDRDALVSSADDVVDRRLGHATHGA